MEINRFINKNVTSETQTCNNWADGLIDMRDGIAAMQRKYCEAEKVIEGPCFGDSSCLGDWDASICYTTSEIEFGRLILIRRDGGNGTKSMPFGT